MAVRRLFLSLTTAALAGQLLAGGYATPAAAAEKYLILAVFPQGCDATCAAYKQAIAASGLPAKIVVRDLSESGGTAENIVQEARAMKASLVLTAGSEATLAVAGRAADAGDRRYLQDIPVIFTGIADPLDDGLIEGAFGSGRANLAGSAALAPLPETLAAIRQLDPEVDRLGYLYNVNEPQAEAVLDDLNRLAAAQGLDLVALDIEPGNSATPDPALIPVRLAEMAELGVTWVYVGASPTLRAESASLAAAAAESGLAIVSGEGGRPAAQRALLTLAASPETLGQNAAEQTLAILRLGVHPGNLPLAEARSFTPLVDLDLAARLLPGADDRDVALNNGALNNGALTDRAGF